MSSLAAVQADGYYYDPERFHPGKRGRDSVNALANSHPLGKRARKLGTEGSLVVRFEMPYDAWCEGCGALIARGVRFNADKKQAGAHHSTKIWEFSMKCTMTTKPGGCDSRIVVRTDPAASDYVFVAGARRKDRGDAGEGDVIVESTGAGGVTRGRAAREPLSLAGLEARASDVARAAEQAGRLRAIAEVSDRRYGSYRADANAAARRVRREADVERRAAEGEGAAAGLAVPLAPAGWYEEEEEGARWAGASAALGMSAGERALILAAPALPHLPLSTAPRSAPTPAGSESAAYRQASAVRHSSVRSVLGGERETSSRHGAAAAGAALARPSVSSIISGGLRALVAREAGVQARAAAVDGRRAVQPLTKGGARWASLAGTLALPPGPVAGPATGAAVALRRVVARPPAR
jgi:coiled-coil domain-containing protein 130